MREKTWKQRFEKNFPYFLSKVSTGNHETIASGIHVCVSGQQRRQVVGEEKNRFAQTMNIIDGGVDGGDHKLMVSHWKEETFR